MNRPSAAVAANRRRFLLWLPLIILGVVIVNTLPAAVTLNSLQILGLGLAAGGAFGFISEIGK